MMNMLSEKYAGLGVVPACEGFDRRAGRRAPRTRAGRDRARAQATFGIEKYLGSGMVKAIMTEVLKERGEAYVALHMELNTGVMEQ